MFGELKTFIYYIIMQ